MKTQYFRDVDETLITTTLPNGLRLQVVPRPAYHKSYAIMTTDYGAIDTRFAPDGKQMVTYPAGIAHFLEHKLFEKKIMMHLIFSARPVRQPMRLPVRQKPASYFPRPLN